MVSKVWNVGVRAVYVSRASNQSKTYNIRIDRKNRAEECAAVVFDEFHAREFRRYLCVLFGLDKDAIDERDVLDGPLEKGKAKAAALNLKSTNPNVRASEAFNLLSIQQDNFRKERERKSK